MVNLTKNKKKVLEILNNKKKKYSLLEAIKLVKKISFTKFDSSFDASIRLNVDPKKSDQLVRGGLVLPHGLGKKQKILVLVSADKEQEIQNHCSPDYIGLDDYINKIQKGWLNFDIIVTMPSIMIKIGPLGKILGPRGLMPNPNNGTVTNDVCNAVNEIQSGKINFKVDKYGIINASIGRVSFINDYIKNNFTEFINFLKKIRPSSCRGEYIKSIFLSSTMSLSIPVDIYSFLS